MKEHVHTSECKGCGKQWNNSEENRVKLREDFLELCEKHTDLSPEVFGQDLIAMCTDMMIDLAPTLEVAIRTARHGVDGGIRFNGMKQGIKVTSEPDEYINKLLEEATILVFDDDNKSLKSVVNVCMNGDAIQLNVERDNEEEDV